MSTGLVTQVEPEFECVEVIKTEDCRSEQIGNALQNIDSNIADLLECADTKPLPLECVKKRTFKVGYDNGFTAGSSTNTCGSRPDLVRFDWPFEVVGWEVNGSSVGAGEALGAWAGWSEQLQGWADFMNANDPNFVEAVSYTHLTLPTICSV